MLIFALAYWDRNFSFVFWENWKYKKALSKLTNLNRPCSPDATTDFETTNYDFYKVSNNPIFSDKKTIEKNPYQTKQDLFEEVKKNWWKFEFVVLKLVVGFGEQNKLGILI